MRKIVTLALLIGMMGASSCAYRTCPTYAKKDAKIEKTQEVSTSHKNM